MERLFFALMILFFLTSSLSAYGFEYDFEYYQMKWAMEEAVREGIEDARRDALREQQARDMGKAWGDVAGQLTILGAKGLWKLGKGAVHQIDKPRSLEEQFPQYADAIKIMRDDGIDEELMKQLLVDAERIEQEKVYLQKQIEREYGIVERQEVR